MPPKGKKNRKDDDDDWENEAEQLRAEMDDPAVAAAAKAALLASVKAENKDAKPAEPKAAEPKAAEPKAAPAKKAAAAPAAPAPAAAAGSDSGSDSEDEDDGKAQGGSMKTAAQKKAEKKEKERLKKEQERLKKAAQKKAEDEAFAAMLGTTAAAPAAAPAAPAAPAAAAPAPAKKPAEPKAADKSGSEGSSSDDDEDDAAAGDGEGAAGDKKKKKKKKDKKKAAAAGTAAAGTAADAAKKPVGKIAKLQAMMAKEAEERRKYEEAEREKQRLFDEAETRRLEALRLEEEKRLAKKQREKEKKEQLKREGKYLTEAERKKRALAAEKLAQLQGVAGIVVPTLDDDHDHTAAAEGEAGAGEAAAAGDHKPAKRVVYGDKRKPKKPAAAAAAAPAPAAATTTLAAAGEEDWDAPEASAEAAVPAAAPAAAAAADAGAEDDEDDWETAASLPVSGPAGDYVAPPAEPAAVTAAATTTTAAAAAAVPEPATAASALAAAAAAAGSTSDAAPAKSAKQLAAEKLAAEKLAREEAAAIARMDDFARQVTLKPAPGALRCPIVCVLGHVDTGKTSLLDKIRRTHVQDGEAGGITQQIGATYFPGSEIARQSRSVVAANAGFELKLPGLLIIDTPGHESFSNLRVRGSSLSDLAVLVIDIMHGLENQTIESIELLRARKTPFVVALNKVDRLVNWTPTPNGAIEASLAKQKSNTLQEYETRVSLVKVALAERGFNSELYYRNKNIASYVNIVPTSAHSGEGIPDLLYLVAHLNQRLLTPQLTLRDELEATVMEVKTIPGLGTTVDVVLRNGVVHEGDTVVLCGLEGPIVTQIRSLLMPEPLRELRVKNAYRTFKTVYAANGIKIAAKDLDRAVAGLPLYIAQTPEEVPALCALVEPLLAQVLQAIQTQERGVYVQASTLGSLEALLAFLKTSKIPVAGINVGPVHKRDVTRASVQLEKRDPDETKNYAMILAFDVPVERDAQLMADGLKIKIFTAQIIYHLFDAFTKHMADLRASLRVKYAAKATFPCRLRILPNCVFNARDPIVLGVVVESGVCKVGTPIVVEPAPRKEGDPEEPLIELGVISSLEVNHEAVEVAKRGTEVCIKIDPAGGDKKMFGRHFDLKNTLISKLSRESIDLCKFYFKEDLSKEDWKLIMAFKDIFGIY